MKRVAYLTPLCCDERWYLGDGGRYPVNLARALAGTGDYEVDIVSSGDVQEVIDRPICRGVRLRLLPSVARHGADRLSWEVLDAISDVDLVHLHQVFSRSSEVGMLAAKLLLKPVCATDHGGGSSSVGRSLGILELADRITCYSAFAGSLLETTTPIELVRGGVDDDFFQPPEPSGVRDRVVFVGRVTPRKGIDRLITALPKEVPLAVCGQSSDRAYLSVLEALARGKEVTFHDDLDDHGLREMYGRALAVVLPSVYVDFNGAVHLRPELMGFSLLEGNACGAPAICSRVGGMPEFVEHGVTGYVYDTLEQLTNQLASLAADRDLVASLGARGVSAVHDRFGLEAAGQAMRSVYDDLLGIRAARSS